MGQQFVQEEILVSRRSGMLLDQSTL